LSPEMYNAYSIISSDVLSRSIILIKWMKECSQLSLFRELTRTLYLLWSLFSEDKLAT